MRFLAFRLISTLVISTTDDVTQLMLLEDLLKESPYDEMKLAGLGLLREVLAGKFDVSPSLYLIRKVLMIFSGWQALDVHSNQSPTQA